MSKIVKYESNTDLVKSSFDSLSTETKKAYDNDLSYFMQFSNKPLNEVTHRDIVDYIAHLRSSGLKNSSINRKISSISKLFKVHVMAGILKINPVEIARQYTKISYKIIRNQVSDLTIQNIKDCVDAENINISDMHCGIMIKFLAKTGLRVSEMLNIKLSDISIINEKACKIRIFGKGSKERFIMLDKDFIEEIKNIFNHKTLLFCNVHNTLYNRKYVWRMVHDRFMRVTNINVHPHSLRHFYATYKIKTEGKDIKAVSKQLGHSNSSITIDYYLDSQFNYEESQIEI